MQHQINLLPELERLENVIDRHKALENKLKSSLLFKGLLPRSKPPAFIHLPVLVIACNRVGIKRTLDALLKHRDNVFGQSLSVSENPGPASTFPITVSHGCDHKPTADILASYGDRISVIKFEDSPTKVTSNLTKFQLPYRSVAHHYKFALDHMLLRENHSALIVVEDDLDIAPDFFAYFTATLPLLKSDRSLFCVSAWNDNGRPNLINQERNDLIYRSDFFAGLGWMLLREFWHEIRTEWPDAFWDEYIRQPWVRNQRSCLRPELGRTVTFGRNGISRGQFFDKYMKTMVLNSVQYDFLHAQLDYLKEDQYLPLWQQKVYNYSVPVSIDDLLADRLPPLELAPSLRVTYTTQNEFLKVARYLVLMEDIKSGVMRNAFRGVVPVTWKRRSLYIAPPSNWTSYETK